jgi:hypothetical protein
MIGRGQAGEQFGALGLRLGLQAVQQLDLAVRQRLDPPGEVDEDLHPLVGLAARGAARCPEHGLPGDPLLPVQVVRQQGERVSFARRDGLRVAEFGALAPLHPPGQLLQLLAAARGQRTQGAHLLVHPAGDRHRRVRGAGQHRHRGRGGDGKHHPGRAGGRFPGEQERGRGQAEEPHRGSRQHSGPEVQSLQPGRGAR